MKKSTNVFMSPEEIDQAVNFALEIAKKFPEHKYSGKNNPTRDDFEYAWGRTYKETLIRNFAYSIMNAVQDKSDVYSPYRKDDETLEQWWERETRRGIKF